MSELKFKKILHEALLPTSQETGVMCTINEESFFAFTKCMWIRDSGASCYITNNDIEMYDITIINESVQVIPGNMKTTKKDKLCIKVRKVDGGEFLNTLWPVNLNCKLMTDMFKLVKIEL